MIKHLLSIVAFLSTALTLSATPTTLTSQKAGEIASEKKLKGLEQITELKISGPINYLDLKEVGKVLQSLEHLDLSEASFVKYFDEDNWEEYGNDTFPPCLSGHPKLSHLELPASTKKIANGALYYTKSLTSLVLHATTPPEIDYYDLADKETYERCTLYVPAEAVAAYKAKAGEGWKFADIRPINAESETPSLSFTTNKASQTFSVKTSPNNKVSVHFPDGTTINGDADEEHGIARFSYKIDTQKVQDASELKVDIICTPLLSFTAQDTGIKAIAIAEGTPLQRLTLTYQQITELSLAPASATLRELYINGNQLSAIDIADCPQLEWLNLSNNPLEKLNGLANCLRLQHLIAYNTQLGDLDLSTLTLLEELDLTNTTLKAIDLSKNTQIKHLNLADNALTSIDLSSLTALVSLDASSNHIEKLSIENPLLEELNVSNNHLTSLDISHCKALKRIACEGNKLTPATLPVFKPATQADYTYAPQQVWDGLKDSYKTFEHIDLSLFENLQGILDAKVPSTLKWFDANNHKAIDRGHYTTQHGDNFGSTFSNEQDSVYCEIYTKAFPEFKDKKAFRTNTIKITISTDTERLAIGAKVTRSKEVIKLSCERPTRYLILTLDGVLIAKGTTHSDATITLPSPNERVILLLNSDKKTTTLKL